MTSISDDTCALYIAAKAPRPGLAKTRLAKDLGDDGALALYRAFLSDLAARFADTSYRLGWYVTPADAWLDLGPLVDHEHCAPRVLVQGRGDWTERQREIFRNAAARGEDRTVLIASDSPQISRSYVDQAFVALDRADVVLGPTCDGGYSLIGMRGWHDVLEGVPMSTSTVLEDILHTAQAAGTSLALLDYTFDVDCVDDLEQLSIAVLRDPTLTATRAQLERLGWLAPELEPMRRPIAVRGSERA